MYRWFDNQAEIYCNPLAVGTALAIYTLGLMFFRGVFVVSSLG